MDGSQQQDFRSQVNERLHAIDRRVDRADQERSEMSRTITDLKHTVWGNGKDGLATRMDRVEQRTLSTAESRKQTWAVIGAVGGFAMGMIGLIVQALIAMASSGKGP